MYYECHITLGLHPVSAKGLIEALGWKYSMIEGDPVLGTGYREYATRIASVKVNEAVVIAEMDYIASVLAHRGFNVLRQKIELVIYDTKGKETKTT
jgi:hypothetical protein